MEELVKNNNVQILIMVIICMNIGLTALSKILEMIKDKTKTDADNKAYDMLHKIISGMAKVVDWASANRQH